RAQVVRGRLQPAPQGRPENRWVSSLTSSLEVRARTDFPAAPRRDSTNTPIRHARTRRRNTRRGGSPLARKPRRASSCAETRLHEYPDTPRADEKTEHAKGGSPFARKLRRASSCAETRLHEYPDTPRADEKTEHASGVPPRSK